MKPVYSAEKKPVLPLFPALCLALLLPLFSLSAQDNSVTGTVMDDVNVLKGAHVILQSAATTTGAAHTDDFGNFRFDRLHPGTYILQLSYLGYRPMEISFYLDETHLHLDSLIMVPDTIGIGEVIIVSRVPMTVVRGDTLEFNADAFHLPPDASAEDLASRLPGVEVEQGRITAQGEPVRRVRVDGRPFFDEDPVAALQNLPAEIVEKIQVFDEQSEQARFTGFDDGQTVRVMNVITRSNMRNGIFGRTTAGYGQNEAYQVAGRLNHFDDSRRISFTGQSNNINNQGFSMMDMPDMGAGGRGDGGRGGGGTRGGAAGRDGGAGRDFMVGRQDGISTTNAIGMNYTNSWFDRVDMTGSYFFSKVDNLNESVRNQNFFATDQMQAYRQDRLSDSDNANHRLSARVQYDINETNRIVVTPRITMQQNSSGANVFGETFRQDALYNQTANYNSSVMSAYGFSNTLLYMHRFGKAGRSVSLNFNTSLNDRQGENLLYAENIYYQRDNLLSDTIDQSANNISHSNSLSGRLMYTEPLSGKSLLQVNYQQGYQWNDADRITYNYNHLTGFYDQADTLLSNKFISRYLTRQAGTGYRYVGEKLNMTAAVDLELASLENARSFPIREEFEFSFSGILPSAMISYMIAPRKSLRLTYNTSSNLPSINQLQDVVDNSSPLRLRTGNPELSQGFQHSVFLRYTTANTERGNVFYIQLRHTTQQDYIANSTFIAAADTLVYGIQLVRGQQLTRPVNLDGFRNNSLMLTYGFPIDAIRSNLNLNSSLSHSRRPGYIDGVHGVSNDRTAGLGLTLRSNISPRLDFSLSGNSSYNMPVSTFRENLDNYFYQRSSARFRYQFTRGWLINTQFSHSFYAGLSDGYNQRFAMWNVSIGRKLFGNQRGEITLSMNDLLNENSQISRNVTDMYIEDAVSNVMPRYYLLSFTYDLRRMGSEGGAGGWRGGGGRGGEGRPGEGRGVEGRSGEGPAGEGRPREGRGREFP